jgi:hypothetical protein
MKAIRLLAMASVVVLSGLAPAQSTENGNAAGSDTARLIGAWHLVSLGGAGVDGDLKGTLIYTSDGHMSVQIMYPPSGAAISNDYVLNGYEASFGSYDVNEKTHTVTHHVQGSITRGLVGKQLSRVYLISGNRLTIKSTNPEEHWQVVWEHE